MARSKKPTAWVEPRKDAEGRVISYRVQWEMNGQRGRPIPCGPSKAHALEVRDKTKADMWAGRLKVQTGRQHSWDALIEESRKHYATKSKNTWSNFVHPALRSFGAFVNGISVEKTDAKHVADWKASLLDAGMSLTTISMYLRNLRAVLNYARKPLGWILENVALEVELPAIGSKGRLLHDDELGIVRPHLEAMRRGRTSAWDILHVALTMGLRNGAICGTDGRQVDRVHRVLKVLQPRRVGGRGQTDLKTEDLKERWVPIHQDVWHIFRDAPISGPVFAGWNHNDVAKAIRRACAAAKVQPFRLHDAKHTFITRYLEAGGTIPGASALTGNTLQSLMVYIHITNRAKHDEVHRVSYFLPPASPQKRNPPKPGKAGRRALSTRN